MDDYEELPPAIKQVRFMKFSTYRNTSTADSLRWSSPIHIDHARGYGYQTDTHFVHFYGRNTGNWTVSPGLCVTQGVAGDLPSWQADLFGAEEFGTSTSEVGHTVAGVWRPGITNYSDIRTGLQTTDSDRHEALQDLRFLLERLDDLFRYIDPNTGQHSFSYKTRELLILACTEVENAWAYYLSQTNAQPQNGNNFTTKDYVRLLAPLFLDEFQCTLKAFPSLPAFRPFYGWSAAQPSQSLAWYEAYNQSKHNRKLHFDKATLRACIEAVAANVTMFSVRFSPFPLFNEGVTTSTLFNQLLNLELIEPRPESFYLPMVAFPPNPNIRLSKFDIDASNLRKPWHVNAFTL